jgi:hypothetical protein
MGALAGFILGYYLGAKQGPEGYAQLRQALETILASPEVKALLERVPFLHATGGNGNGAPRGEVSEAGKLTAVFRALAESEAIQSLLAGGVDFARSLLSRGRNRDV